MKSFMVFLSSVGGEFARGFGYVPHQRIRGAWHGRAGEVGSSIVGVRGRSSPQGGRPAMPPVRFPEQRAAERSGPRQSCAPSRLFNRIGHDRRVVNKIPQLHARNAPDPSIRLYVYVLYGLAMHAEGCGKCSACHKGMRIGCHEVNHR